MKSMKKVTLLMATMLTAVSIVAPVSAAPKYDYNVRIDVNKTPMQSDVKPFIDNATSRTYVPIRYVSQALNEKVTWDNKTKTVTVTASGKKISLSRGQKFAVVNGKKVEIDAPALEVQNRVMIPLRIVSEQIGAVVDVKKLKGMTYVSIAYAGAPKPGKEQPGKEDGKKTYTSFELDKKYNTLAPYLFKDNLKVVDGKLKFKVPNLDRVGATFWDFGKKQDLVPGKEYTFDLGQKSYIGFYLAHKDENIEGYFVYLNPNNEDLDGDFKNVKNDVIVVNNLTNKQTASPLKEVQKQFK